MATYSCDVKYLGSVLNLNEYRSKCICKITVFVSATGYLAFKQIQDCISIALTTICTVVFELFSRIISKQVAELRTLHRPFFLVLSLLSSFSINFLTKTWMKFHFNSATYSTLPLSSLPSLPDHRFRVMSRH